MGSTIKTVFLAPLDWGLGHATRLIPIIDYLHEQGHRVIVGGSGPSGSLLKQRYPHLKYVELPDYKLSYSRTVPLVLHMTKQVPFVWGQVSLEKKIVAQTCKDEKVDLIINDNRFGVWAEGVSSAYITHQLIVPAPRGMKFLEYVVSKLHNLYIKPHKYILIPDFENEPSIARRLSHPKKKKSYYEYIYLGPLSRFKAQPKPDTFDFKVLILLSGLEPHRGDWEADLLEQAKDYSKDEIALVRGLPHLDEIPKGIDDVCTAFNHLPADKLKDLILKSETVVCRSGYSTLMDLLCLGKKALICATPGQTEQVYLADILPAEGNFYSMRQNKFDLKKGISELLKRPDPEPLKPFWPEVIEELIQRD